MAAAKPDWDPARYESSHDFVWKLGADLVTILGAQPGERVLDVGCGTGHLTARLAESGADVIGIDSSPAMVAQARQNFPGLRFQLADAQTYHADQPFHAVFSNAALHWIHDADSVAECISQALRPGGRLVLEMGTHGNIARLLSALNSEIRNYFPTLGEYAVVLERHGLEVASAAVFDRPTPLEGGESGLREWMATFRPDNKRPIEEVEAELRPILFRDGRWVADYRRLRVIARKLS